MELGLEGKAAIITGGSKGIGRSIALGLAREKVDVAICARSPDALFATEEELKALGVRTYAAVCDVGDAGKLERFVNAAHATLGRLDILVNNVSGFGATDDEAGWERSIELDLLALVRGTRYALPLIERQGGGAVVHISSISGLQASGRTPPYGAVKAAVIQYTATQALQLAKQNIRVNCIAPGSIEFPGGSWEARKTEAPKVYQSVLDAIPFGRLGRPDEVANAAIFLASDAASWITGRTLVVDGGQML